MTRCFCQRLCFKMFSHCPTIEICLTLGKTEVFTLYTSRFRSSVFHVDQILVNICLTILRESGFMKYTFREIHIEAEGGDVKF